MKRVAFAFTAFWYDFDTKEELDRYVDNLKKKGTYFRIQNIYDNGKFWTLVIYRQYKNYETGF